MMDSPLVYSIALSISVLILAVIFYWYYKNFIAAYSQFPSYSLSFRIVYWILTNKCPKHIPLTSFFLQKVADVCKKYESEGVCVIWVFSPYLLIFGEEAIKTFSSEVEALDKPADYKIFDDAIGSGLITSNGEKWKNHRKMLNPLFRLKMLKEKTCIFNKYATVIVKRLEETTDGSSIDLASILPLYLLSSTIESLTGQKPDELVADILEACHLVEKLTEFTTYRMLRPYLRWKFMLNLFPLGRKNLKYYEARDTLSRKAVMVIKDSLMKSRDLDKSNAGHPEHSSCHMEKSLFEELLEIHLKDPSFTIQDVEDELITLLVAGFDTVNYALVWCIFMLGLHEDVQEQVYNEVQSLTHNEVTYDDLQEMPYLDCVIKETMRLYSTVPIYGRRLKKDTKCGKYTVPKGTKIGFFPYVYHRNSELYPDPERFDPERFKSGNPMNRSWTYIPFSEGLRNCIGKNFALIEMKIILVHIIRKFKIMSLDRREDLDLDWAIVVKSVRPLRIKLSLR